MIGRYAIARMPCTSAPGPERRQIGAIEHIGDEHRSRLEATAWNTG